MYFMLCLPNEEETDIEAIVELAKKLKTELQKIKGAFELTFSVSTYIPKPHTPFERANRCEKKTLEKRINYLKKNLSKLGVKFRAPSVDWDIVQSILSRYDDSLADFLIEVVDNGSNLGAFKQIWRKQNKKGLLPDYDSCAKAPLNNIKTLKWDFILSGAQVLKKRKEQVVVSSLKQGCFINH